MKTFTINGKEYKAKAFDFNAICDLEDMGIAIEQIGNKSMSMVRAYFGLCAGKSKEDAGKEFEAHIIGGGKFDDIMSAMVDEIENSDFFQALNKTAEAEIAKNQTEESKKE